MGCHFRIAGLFLLERALPLWSRARKRKLPFKKTSWIDVVIFPYNNSRVFRLHWSIVALNCMEWSRALLKLMLKQTLVFASEASKGRLLILIINLILNELGTLSRRGREMAGVSSPALRKMSHHLECGAISSYLRSHDRPAQLPPRKHMAANWGHIKKDLYSEKVTNCHES